MCRLFWSVIVLCLSLSVAGCGTDPATPFTHDVFNTWNEYADICTRVKDEETAKAYFDYQLQAIKKRWDELEPRRRDMAG